MRKLRYYVILFTIFLLDYQCASQTFVFAELNGTPNINTIGWNLTGNAYTGDTGGDLDASPNELILTNASGNQSGGVFYGTPINPSLCSKWTVEFDYRIWGGSAADGLAFCFLDVPPSGFVNGQGVGIPGTANGLKVILDTWNNCGGPNPELQIYSGVGYGECNAGIVKIDNTTNSLGFMRSNNYQPVKITYLNGAVTVFINNTQYLTANFPINFVGYMGFTASTGGSTDQHSVRNVIIYTDQATSNAGPDLSICTGENGQIGSISSPSNVYSWSPAIGLSATNVSNPSVTLTNFGNSPITQIYTVTTSLASNPGVCPTTDQVTVTVYPNIYTNVNAAICDNESFNFDNLLIDNAGIYIDSLQTVYGCDSVVTLSLTVNPTNIDSIVAQICQGDVYNLGPQQISSAGTYTQVFQSSLGCDSTVVLELIVNSLPLLSCQGAIICQGDTAILTPLGSDSYVWTPTIGSINTNGNLTVSPAQTTVFNLTGTDVNGCSSNLNVTVIVQQAPNIQLSLDNNPACIGESVLTTVSGGTFYEWVTPSLINQNANSQLLTANNSQLIQVIGYDNLGCSSKDSINLIVNPLPLLSITPSQSICVGETVQISVSGALTYNWIPQGNGSTSQFSPLTTTNYSITGIDLNGCENVISTSILVNPKPIANLSAEPLITTSDSPEINFFNNSEGVTQYYLQLGDGSVIEEEIPSVYTYTYPFTEGNYQVYMLVENQFGCTDSTILYIQVKGDEIFYIPNTFTPDGDEHNNLFVPVFTNGFDPANFELEIYDRWGELIFQSFNAEKGWNGHFNGELSQVGTYVWKIMYKNPDLDEYKVITGHVNLIR